MSPSHWQILLSLFIINCQQCHKVTKSPPFYIKKFLKAHLLLAATSFFIIGSKMKHFVKFSSLGTHMAIPDMKPCSNMGDKYRLKGRQLWVSRCCKKKFIRSQIFKISTTKTFVIVNIYWLVCVPLLFWSHNSLVISFWDHMSLLLKTTSFFLTWNPTVTKPYQKQ